MPTKRKRTNTTTKAKRDATALMRADLSRTPMGLLSTGDYGERVSGQALVKRYGRWVHRCVGLVAETAAAVPMRLFVIGGKETVEKNYALRTKPLDMRTKAYLRGLKDMRPGAVAQKRIAGNIDDMTEITSHPALDLIDRINPWQSGFAFRDLWYRDLQTVGQFFTHIVADLDDAPPTELWRFVPTKMKIIPSSTEFIERFEYGDGPNKTTFTRDEVFWLALPHLSDPWGCYSPLAAWLKTIDADYAMVAFQDWLFRHGGQPDVIFTVKGGMEQKARNAFRSEWRSMFGDQTNRRENMGILEGEAELHELSHAPKEMEYRESRDQVRDEIGNCFGVPKSLLTSDDVNRANGDAGLIQLMRHTVWPLVRRVEDEINQRLLPRWSDRLVLIHDNPVPEDRTARITERASYLGAGYTINEVRMQDGDEPLDDPQADVPMVAAGIVPLSMAGLSGLGGVLNDDGETSETPATESGEAAGAPMPEGEQSGAVVTNDLRATVGGSAAILALQEAYYAGKIPRDSAIANATLVFGFTAPEAEQLFPELPPDAPKSEAQIADEEAAREALTNPKPKPGEGDDAKPPPKSHGEVSQKAMLFEAWTVKDDDFRVARRIEAQATRGEQAFGRAVESVLLAQAHALIKAMGTMGELITVQQAIEIVMSDDWTKALADAALPHIERQALFGGRAGLARIGLDVSFEAANPAVQRYVDTHVTRLASTAQETTQVALRDLLGDGIEKGETIAELRERVRTWAEGDPATGRIGTAGYRSEMIARTESSRAFVRGQEVAWKESGVVEGKRWVLAADPCEFCQAAADEFNSKMVGVDAPFYAKGSVLTGTQGGTLTIDYDDVHGGDLHPHCRCNVVPVLKEE